MAEFFGLLAGIVINIGLPGLLIVCAMRIRYAERDIQRLKTQVAALEARDAARSTVYR